MRKIFILALSLSFLAAAGCQLFSDDPSSPASNPTGDDPAEESINLNSPTGGYTATDEQPAFGEPENFNFTEKENEYQDRFRNTRQYKKRIELEGARKYRLRAIWGKLAEAYQDSTDNDCCPVDFSGSLEFEAGVVVIERTIGFEMLDYVTRIDGSTIEWVSHTCPGVDGIQVKLVAPPVNPPADDDSLEIDELDYDEDDVVLTIKAGPYSGSFTMAQLDSLDIVEPVDRCGNGVMIRSHPDLPCPHGYMAGRWIHVEPDTIVSPEDSTETRGIIRGRFRGIWISDRGRPAGYLRGVFGLNSLGESVFYGKYIDFRGRFKGFLKGHYGSDISSYSATPAGWYKGIWMGRNAAREGNLAGEWISAGQNGAGFFHGKWWKECRMIDVE